MAPLIGAQAAGAEVVPVRIPARTMSGGPTSNQRMGSIYEHAMWVLCDAVIDQLIAELQLDRAGIAEHHNNLE